MLLDAEDLQGVDQLLLLIGQRAQLFLQTWEEGGLNRAPVGGEEVSELAHCFFLTLLITNSIHTLGISQEKVMKKEDRLRQYTERYNTLKAEIQTVGFVSQGSINTRRNQCGKDYCHCHKDPKNLHGPYHYWTRKSAAKTVTLHFLSPVACS